MCYPILQYQCFLSSWIYCSIPGIFSSGLRGKQVVVLFWPQQGQREKESIWWRSLDCHSIVCQTPGHWLLFMMCSMPRMGEVFASLLFAYTKKYSIFNADCVFESLEHMVLKTKLLCVNYKQKSKIDCESVVEWKSFLFAPNLWAKFQPQYFTLTLSSVIIIMCCKHEHSERRDDFLIDFQHGFIRYLVVSHLSVFVSWVLKDVFLNVHWMIFQHIRQIPVYM